jgi:hypothetical protein
MPETLTDVSRTVLSEKKQWAREYLRGLGSLVMPSFTPDFKSLDEEGIRLDIRHRIKQGFTSMTVSANGATSEQSKRMWELVREEAMVSYPRDAKSETEADVYANLRKIIESTSMAVLLYGSPVESLRKFHPSGIPLQVFDSQIFQMWSAMSTPERSSDVIPKRPLGRTMLILGDRLR